MKDFRQYVDYLEGLVLEVSDQGLRQSDSLAINAALNGQPAEQLRRLVPISIRREAGAFLTGSRLARHALRNFRQSDPEDVVFFDPACGTGDLLIQCSYRLPLGSSLKETLRFWGKRLIGRDIFPEFVRATKLRLLLTAIHRVSPMGKIDLPDIDGLFPRIECKSSLMDKDVFGNAKCIVVNPPFTMMAAPRDCKWAAGKVNTAAVFFETCLTHSQPGTKIIAILPDVLRSGSRYTKWRILTQLKCNIKSVEVIGQFCRYADIDVFVLRAEVKNGLSMGCKQGWGTRDSSLTPSLSHYFDVSVGPVVDYRDPHNGQWYPFLVARDLPPWEAVHEFPKHRRFAGRTIVPPFVAIRRTSRPGDKCRAIGTVVLGDNPVAVENHLLVLRPVDDSVRRCMQLIDILRMPRTSEWLNSRIRCRHLTVAAIRELPLVWINNGKIKI